MFQTRQCLQTTDGVAEDTFSLSRQITPVHIFGRPRCAIARHITPEFMGTGDLQNTPIFWKPLSRKQIDAGSQELTSRESSPQSIIHKFGKHFDASSQQHTGLGDRQITPMLIFRNNFNRKPVGVGSKELTPRESSPRSFSHTSGIPLDASNQQHTPLLFVGLDINTDECSG